MKPYRQLSFDIYRFDEANECLWRNSELISLRPKAYAVLKYLVTHPGTLVTKQQLLDAVWPDTFVGDAVLKDSIRQLRDLLGDEAKSPRFIETAHRRGYRFIAPVTETEARGIPEETSERRSNISTSARLPDYLQAVPSVPVTVLGRDPGLARMLSFLASALRANTQMVFVTGEPGIGKTTFVEAFLHQATAIHGISIARGQCLEQYGAGEAYLPVLDALSRLARESAGERVVNELRRHAPTWLIQMPGLTTAADREALQKEVLGASRERMLREMAQALEALTAEKPLVLVLEDLHWSDYSTLDLISYLARRRHATRLMVVGTYRPVEVILNEHPLKGVKQELQMHRLCEELPLEYLTEGNVVEFLAGNFPGNDFPTGLAQLIHQRTEGNPLFIVNVVDYLLDRKTIVEVGGRWKLRVELAEVEVGVPENIRHLIEKQIERLNDEEQRILEGASIVGMDCSAVAMSAGLGEDVMKIEEVCDSLARRHQFILPAYLTELPDGTITPRYRFIHALYLDVLYKRVAATRRSQIHGRIGERGEAIYGERVGEIAAELAVHFEQARDWNRAVKYLQLAAENAAGRFANHEAVALAHHGLELLDTLPEMPACATREPALRRILEGPAD